MKKQKRQWRSGVWVCCGLMIATCWCVKEASAQDGASAQPDVAEHLELDVQMLITGQGPARVVQMQQADQHSAGADKRKSTHRPGQPAVRKATKSTDSASDSVWRIKPRPGRKLLHVPIVVTPATQPFEVAASTVRVRGGRLIAWQIDKEDIADFVDPLPVGAPRIARKITVQPDGTIQWSFDGRISGATIVDAGNNYALRADARLLKKQKPVRPRLKRRSSEDAATFSRRRAEAVKSYRQATTEYRERRKAIKELVIDFAQPMPARLWAIFEVNPASKQLVIDGTAAGEWSISMAQFQKLRQTAGLGGAYLNAWLPKRIQRMEALISRDAHSYTLLAVAHTLRSCGVLEKYDQAARIRSALLVPLLRNLLAVHDADTRLIVASGLAAHPPRPGGSDKASRVGESLLALALRDSDPQVQLAALGGVLRSSADDPLRTRRMIDEANRFLEGGVGIDPAHLLGKLLTTAQQRPDLAETLVSQIRLGRLEGDQLDRAIVLVVAKALHDKVAAGWLDRQLLGSVSRAQVKRTLLVLEAAESGQSVVKLAVHRMLDAWLGSARVTHSADAVPQVALDGLIALDSSSHSMFRVLQSGDAETRGLAWRVLGRFELPGGNSAARGGRRPPRTGSVPPGDDPYDALVRAATSMDPTPPQAVAFLARQPDEQRSTDGLVALVAQGTDAAAAAAARSLFGFDLPLARALRKLPAEQRARFGDVMYQARRVNPPLVTPLLGVDSKNAPIVEWFGRQVAAGMLPESHLWAEPFDRDSQLLDVVISKDKNLSLAAVAALVARAGGSESRVEAIHDSLTDGGNATRAMLTPAWNEQRRNIFLDRIKSAAGTHHLLLRVYTAEPPQRPGDRRPGDRQPAPPRQVDKTYDLGQVDLQVGDDSVSLGTTAVSLSVPAEYLAVRFDNPSELKDLASREIGALPLEKMRRPGWIDLEPQQHGDWRGNAVLSDGRRIELVLRPVTDGT